jgi:hypothetical protein
MYAQDRGSVVSLSWPSGAQCWCRSGRFCSCSWSNDVVVRERKERGREKALQEEKELTFLRTFHLDQSANAPSLELRCRLIKESYIQTSPSLSSTPTTTFLLF